MKPYSRRLALGQMNISTTSERETILSARRNAPALTHNQLFQHNAAPKGAGPSQSRARAVAGASWLGGSGHTKPALVRRPVRPPTRASVGREKTTLQAQHFDAVAAANEQRQAECSASDGRICGKEEAAGGMSKISDSAPPPAIAKDALEEGGCCCNYSGGSFGSNVARVATGGTWRRPGRTSGQGGCHVSQWAPEGPSVIVTFRPDGVEDAKLKVSVLNPANVGHSAEQKMRLESLVAGQDSAGGGVLQQPMTHGGGPDDGGSLGVTSTTVYAADKDAAAHCGQKCCVAAGGAGRGGRGHGGGNVRGRGGRGGLGRGGLGGTRLMCRRAAVQLQSAARGMLARRLRAQMGLERRKAAARARLERREVEEKARRKARGIERRVDRKAEVCPLEAAGACSEAAVGADEAKIVAEVEARWRNWLAAVRAAAATVHADLSRRLHEAETARVEAEAAAVRAEADRAEMAAECEGMAAALVRQALAAPVAARSAGSPTGRKLVVVEECEWEAEAGTQTEALGMTAAAVQTEAVEAVEVATAAVQTEIVGVAEEAPVEMVVGRQLHPAQAKAVERAERAAAQIERMQAEAAAAAARYRAASEGATPSAESDGRKTAKQETASPATHRGQTTPTGGRQLKKAQLRRQAAAAGVDVLSWTAGKQRHRQERAEAERGGRVWQAELEQRLDAAHEEWRQQQKHMQQDGEHVGEAQASRRFWQAARDSGINLMDVPD